VSTGAIAVASTSSDKGTVYSVDGQTLEIHYRPIQPMTSIDVTVDGLVARGAIITDWTSQDYVEPDIAYSRPVIDDGDAEPEIEDPNSVFPSTFAAVADYERPSTTPGNRTERRQNLNLIVGQYNAPLERQRLFDDIEVDVLYVDPDSPLADDETPAVIEQVQASIVGPPTDRTVGFIVDVAGETPAARVVVLYRSDIEGAPWRTAELTSASPWSGGGPLEAGTTEVEYVVQVARENGLVSVSSSKGTFHRAVEAAPPPATVALDGLNPGGTWYTGPVTVIVEDAAGVTVDGAPVDPTGATISDDGVHIVEVTDGAGETSTFIVPIDKTDPTVSSRTPAEIALGAVAVVDYDCSDAGSGVVSCVGSPTAGTPIDTNALGSGSFTVTATDDAGNTTTQTFGYEVVPQADGDADGFSDLVEVDAGSDPSDFGSVPPVPAVIEAIAAIEDLSTQPGIDSDAAEKLIKAVEELEKALEEFSEEKTADAIDKIKKAVEELEEAKDKDPSLDLAALDSLLVRAARSAAVIDIDEATRYFPSFDKVAEANEKLAEGDTERAAGDLVEAIKKYKDAADKVKDLRFEGELDAVTVSRIDAVNELIVDLSAVTANDDASDKIDDAAEKLEKAIEEFVKGHTDHAIDDLKEAVKKLREAEEKDSSLDLGELVSGVAGLGRTAASTDITIARQNDPTSDKIPEARDLLAEGDALRVAGNFEDALEMYKKAAEKVKDLL
jgi:tetratricopeptide (TPR) repeat protein